MRRRFCFIGLALLILTILLTPATVQQAEQKPLFPIYINGVAGFMDQSAQVVVSPRFDEVYEFSDRMAAVRTAAGWGFINETGKTIVPARFSYVQSFTEGLALVRTDTGDAFIGKHGELTIPLSQVGHTVFRTVWLA